MTGFDGKTVSRFYSDFRQLVGSTIEEEDTIIGGPGIVVEVDETKLGKRKYHRGHRVDGVWVVVGVERTPDRRVFAIPVQNRNAETLKEIIESHVVQGSILHTDCWKGYSCIEKDLGLEHYTVNHSVGFINHETGAHTNFVEGTNFAIKRQIPIRARVADGVAGHLSEFIWRRKNNSNLWDSFVGALIDIHYDLNQ